MIDVTLKEVFTGFSEDAAIFDKFVDPPWDDERTSASLNLEYFLMQSGSKLASPLVTALLSNDGSITEENRGKIAYIIQSKYAKKWERLWLTNSVNYNPIHNYDMTEQINRTLGVIGTDRGSVTRNDDTTTTHTLGSTETISHGRVVTDVDSHYGFNSTEASPADETVSTESGTTTTGNSGSNTDVVDSTVVDVTDMGKNRNETENTVTNRSGNIGVTTSQQMVQAERELWMWNYFNEVFRDLDSILAITAYDLCRL